ncbi:zinc-binding dehydrogenase [Streptomyces sp. NBC_01764]|uniref:zinc-binding dehydrogenase n=1 Tax=Streptomyces sp. NBC_01764 TaxID=2975935 RepID=UPI00225ABA4E|nr:zinc-binding dehydrogenase [Streptomyces sp. NBC_01764]MCX4404534.1 zinc-binding dehydrogenase [Streptomyces sp. NBC_01764]
MTAASGVSSPHCSLLDEGAEAVIVTGEEDVVTRVNELTDGHGARVIFDPAGGPALAGLTGAAAPGGTVIIYGALSSEATTVPVWGLIFKSLTIRRYKVHELTTDVERRKAAVDWVLDGLARKTLRPVIDTVFPLEDIVGARRRLESGSQVGKIPPTHRSRGGHGPVRRSALTCRMVKNVTGSWSPLARRAARRGPAPVSGFDARGHPA